jgi:hypothetical protein
MQARRRLVGSLVILVGTLIVAACATKLHGDVRYSHDVDFTRFKSFSMATLRKAPSPEAAKNRAFAQQEITQALTAKGLRHTETGGDLLVKVRMGLRSKVATSGGSNWGTAAGIQIELWDPQQNDILWEGWASESYYDDLDPKVEIRKAVALILEQFPPA